MPISWIPTRDALEAALATAVDVDRAIGLELLSSLNGAGQTYDAFSAQLTDPATQPSAEYLAFIAQELVTAKEVDEAARAGAIAAGAPLPALAYPNPTDDAAVNAYSAAVRTRVQSTLLLPGLPEGHKLLLQRYASYRRPVAVAPAKFPAQQRFPTTTSGKTYPDSFFKIEKKVTDLLAQITAWMAVKNTAP